MAVVYSTGPVENEGPTTDSTFIPVSDAVMVEVLNNSNRSITATISAFDLRRVGKNSIPVNPFFGEGTGTFTIPPNSTRFVNFFINAVPRFEVRVRIASGILNNNQLLRLVLPSVWGQNTGFPTFVHRILTSELKVVGTPVSPTSTSSPNKPNLRQHRRK